ncbi:hypothetical protein H5410_042209 [Solanum commersonii]|uniref:Uncharacterized protein n=1 Tax=Solanum commersonii TaxID=4109 RepID=A0A9J5XVR1_SOLCO|nr:hypothetical protein H5410_042209 [Solanum commersonii]
MVLTGETTHFQGQTSPRAVYGFLRFKNIDMIFCQNISWTSVKTLAIEPIGPNEQTEPFSSLSRHINRPIFKVKRFQSNPWFFGNSEFRCHFWQKFSWTSAKTLAIESVGPDG